jgi:site-specific DNA-methyltransferase (adenine-specific)
MEDTNQAVYADEWVKLYCGDARHMAQVRDGSAHLVVTSPPYWDIKNYRHEGQIGLGQSYEGYLTQLAVVGLEMLRVLEAGRFLCWVIGTRISDGELKHIPADSTRIFSQLGFVLRKEFIWVKPKGTQGLWQRGTTQFLRDRPYPGYANINIQHEYILVFQKPGQVPVREEHRLTEEFIKRTAWSVWEMAVSQVKGHPAPFPLELPRRLIQLFSYPGETVLDPFVGTGTTLLAARELGRLGIGYDVSPGYCGLAARLLVGDALQPRLMEG